MLNVFGVSQGLGINFCVRPISRAEKKLNPVFSLERRNGRASDVRRPFGCHLGLVYPRGPGSRPIWHLKAGIWGQEGADAQQKLISMAENGSGKRAVMVQERRENGSRDGDVDELDVDRRIVVAVGPSWAGPRVRWE